MVRQRFGERETKETTPVSSDVSELKSKKKKSSKLIFAVLIGLFVILYVIIPLTFYLCPSVRRHVVFLHCVSLSRSKNLSLPREVGLNCTRHFNIQSDGDIKLGAWHVPAREAMSRCKDDVIAPGEEFSDSRPVFLYFHGNAGTRGGGHRVYLYNVLSQKVNAHVITFDYRGYGDSSFVSPTQDGVVNDALQAYYWLRKHVDMNRIYIWGHSLGTGVATAALDKLLQNQEIPAGLILEAPFTKLMDAVKHHPLSIFHRYMPFFDFFFTDPIGSETKLFNSIDIIGRLKSAVLILHAEDDAFIPYHQGKQLHERSLEERPKDYLTQFVGFESKHGYGHKNIYLDQALPGIITQFIESANAKIVKT